MTHSDPNLANRISKTNGGYREEDDFRGNSGLKVYCIRLLQLDCIRLLQLDCIRLLQLGAPDLYEWRSWSGAKLMQPCGEQTAIARRLNAKGMGFVFRFRAN